MPNERKTEAIVRSHFKKFESILHIEEQDSDNVRIKKLLAIASKKVTGRGRPEFLISFNSNSDFLIVVECKADISKHQSKTKDSYAKYTVDGVLLYASYLAKDFDVLAIAVSGETTQHLKISHFLHLKNNKNATEVFGNHLLDANDYLKGYLKSPEKFRQDYSSLLEFARTLNEKLHAHKILESQRSLLISCILIALENEAFNASYKSHKSPKNLANVLVKTVLDELESANITEEKLKNLKIQFSFIKTDTPLSKGEEILKNLICEIDENINQFIKTYEYFDVLGQLYIEFLRYANSDKGLGIVLTPPHICELFIELAGVNKNSIVYDNCTGTGGFLISAMKKMIEDAKGDQQKIQLIKSSQLLGVEYQAHIFALAVSNMYIHQDGKTNIINADSLSDNVIKLIKEQKPTVGLLNPPYKSNKKNDTDEWEFILKNLECLVTGGTCVAIIPMQSVLAQKGKAMEFKKQLLINHTLEAVLSMPDELFFNSKVSIVSCVVVLTAHKPHPKNKAVYFGYYKDDGFIKRKIEGRVDIYGRWWNIKNLWLDSYINRTPKPGISVNKVVKAEDEWCAEAYMDTDYSKLSNQDFENTLLNYAAYLFSNKLINAASNKPFMTSRISLSQMKWTLFKLSDLFEIYGSKTTPVLELEKYGIGKYPYVTTQATNNGVSGFYDFSTEDGNVLTIDSAVLGYCSYQAYNFSASDHVEILKPKFKINKPIALFLVTIMNLERYRYNYGRKCSQSRMKEISIQLPTEGDTLDLSGMETFIQSLPYSSSIF